MEYCYFEILVNPLRISRLNDKKRPTITVKILQILCLLYRYVACLGEVNCS
jgi:hypothetical protein